MVASAPNLCLLRTIAIGSEAAEERGARRSSNMFLSSVASAVFWRHNIGATSDRFKRDTDADAGVATACDPGTRTLRGELFVPKGSKQSFTFPRFACSVSLIFFFLPCKNLPWEFRSNKNNTNKQYFMAFLPPKVAGFVPATAPDDPLLTESITITMASAPGVIPCSQMPPGYEALTEGNFNVTTGLLENGDQRFLHYHSH